MQASPFGAIGLGLIAALLLLGGLAVWVARHPQWRGVPHSLAALPVIDQLRVWAAAHFGGLMTALRDRLGRQWAAAAALLAGLIAVMVLAVGFTALLDDALEGDGMAQFDEPAVAWLATHREGRLNTALTLVTHLGDPPAQTIWLIVVCTLCAWRSQSWLPVILGLAGGIGIAVVLVTAKTLVGRQRPELPFALVDSHGFSFPSGHAAGAAAVGLLCAWMLSRWVVHRWAGQVAVWALTITAIIMIGFSRLYLGVHFVTDVLAGWLLGTAWTATVILVTAWWSRPDRPRILPNRRRTRSHSMSPNDPERHHQP
jgi:membrane-associated phospholipid phosphatase